MKNKLKNFSASLLLIFGVAAIALPVPAGAIDVFSGSCGGSNGQGNTGTGNNNGGANNGGGSSSSICGAASSDDAPDIVKNIINTMLIVLGMIAVIMIVIGGIRYTTSNGDASQIKAAKETILYAVVGLVVAIMAFAIVNFVVGQLSKA